MQFDTPATTNPIDQLKVVGQPIPRIDGQLKVTGRAMYAYEWHDPKVRCAYGYPVGAAIAKGRIKSMDVSAAKKAPGVIAVVTALDEGTGRRASSTPPNSSAATRCSITIRRSPWSWRRHSSRPVPPPL